jgi:hypothetical protein
VPEGSDIYRIAKDGTPSRLVQMKDDVVYSLSFRKGALLAATGNRGRIYRVDTAMPGRFTDVTHLDAAQGMAFAPLKDGVLVATSNSGKLFRLSDTSAKSSTLRGSHSGGAWRRGPLEASSLLSCGCAAATSRAR